MSCPQMEAHLRARTVPVSKAEVKAGDIAVFYRYNYLSHTAIVLPPGDVVCHKPGAEVLSIDPIEEVTCFYGAVTYARELKKVKEQFDKCQKCVIVKL